MTAKICPDCGTPWPARIEFRRCPTCQVDTEPTIHATSISHAEAERRVRHVEFERYYVAREAQRIADGRPEPTPEETEAELCRILGEEAARLRVKKP